ncbi:MAG: hypothetical protein ACO22Z_00835 [Paracoccaceae bacterium]
MAEITRDTIVGRWVLLDQGDTLNAVCRANPSAIDHLKAGAR